MKKYIVTFAFIVASMFNIVAQNTVVVRKGNTFIATNVKACENIKTEFVYNVGGVNYPIYLGVRGGVYIIINGKKNYNLPKEVKDTVKKAYGK